MSQILVARDRDADLIPSNVRAGVTIDDTLGTYEGLGWLAQANSIYSNDTVVNDRLSLWYRVDYNWPWTPYLFEYWNNIYMCCVGWMNLSPTNMYITMFVLDKSTWIITRVYVDNWLNIADAASIWASSAYLDWDYVYINIIWYSPIWYFKYDLTNDTATVVWWTYTSWTALSSSVISWWKTFTWWNKNPVWYNNRWFIRHISIS